MLERVGAGRLQTFDAVLLAERQHAKAAAERLLGMAPLVQQSLDQHGAAGPNGGSARIQRVGVPPPRDFAVRRGRVRVDRCVPSLEGAVGVAGNALAALEDFAKKEALESAPFVFEWLVF